MKFISTAGNLSAILSAASRVVARRNTYPILANCCLSIADGVLTARTTDLDMEIKLETQVDESANGATTIPSHTFSEILRKYDSDAKVSFELNDSKDTATIKCGRSRFNIAALSADGFPDLKSEDIDATFSINGKVLSSCFERVSFAVSNEETRYYLNGVHVHSMDGGKVRFVATDGHRMARLTAEIEGASSIPAIIVPTKTINEIIRLTGSTNDDVSVSIGKTRITVSVGTTELRSKLIEGTFPDYERVIPQNRNLVAVVDRKEINIANDRVSVVTGEKNKGVKVSFSTSQCVLECRHADHGSADETLTIEYGGTDISIGFNARYLAEAINAFSTDKLSIGMADSASPATVSGDDDLLVVLMPMRM